MSRFAQVTKAARSTVHLAHNKTMHNYTNVPTVHHRSSYGSHSTPHSRTRNSPRLPALHKRPSTLLPHLSQRHENNAMARRRHSRLQFRSQPAHLRIRELQRAATHTSGLGPEVRTAPIEHSMARALIRIVTRRVMCVSQWLQC